MARRSVDPYFALKAPSFFVHETGTIKFVIDGKFRILKTDKVWNSPNYGRFHRVIDKKKGNLICHEHLDGFSEYIPISPGQVISIKDGVLQENPFSAWELMNKMPYRFIGSSRYEENLQDKYTVLNAGLSYLFCTTPRNFNEEAGDAEDLNIRILLDNLKQERETLALGNALPEEQKKYLRAQARTFDSAKLLDERARQSQEIYKKPDD